MSEIRHISYDSTYLNKQMALAVYLPDEYKYGSNSLYCIFCMEEVVMSLLLSS